MSASLPASRAASSTAARPLAIVTGASSGIGHELARCCAKHGYDLVIASDEPMIHIARAELQALGVAVDAVKVDLATPEGVEQVIAAVGTRNVDALLANAGEGLGHAFLDQDFGRVRHVINTNIVGTIDLVQKIGVHMRGRGKGRILITGSIAGFVPGSFQAVYNGTKAFIDSFSFALRNELKDSGVTVTCLMPGATDTDFFDRADMKDTLVGRAKKDDPAMVAKVGFKAMLAGDGDVVSGFKNKLLVAAAAITPSAVLAEQHRKMSQPNSAPR